MNENRVELCASQEWNINKGKSEITFADNNLNTWHFSLSDV